MTPLPAVTRRIRRCESEVPAQLVLEHAIAERVAAAVAEERAAIEKAIYTALRQVWAKNELEVAKNPWFPSDCINAACGAICARASTGTATAKDSLIVGQSSGTEKP